MSDPTGELGLHPQWLRWGGGRREDNSGKPSSECVSASACGSERHRGPHRATCCHTRDTAWELWVLGGMGVSGTPRPPADGTSAHAGVSLRCLPARVDGLKLARPGSPAPSRFPRCCERCSVSVQPHTDEADGKSRPSARGLESHASVGGGGDQRGLLGRSRGSAKLSPVQLLYFLAGGFEPGAMSRSLGFLE